jgi:hypothetical protein
MSLLDSTAAGLVLPEVVGPLIIQPLRALRNSECIDESVECAAVEQ